jgi:hypothetical protein
MGLPFKKEASIYALLGIRNPSLRELRSIGRIVCVRIVSAQALPTLLWPLPNNALLDTNSVALRQHLRPYPQREELTTIRAKEPVSPPGLYIKKPLRIAVRDALAVNGADGNVVQK